MKTKSLIAWALAVLLALIPLFALGEELDGVWRGASGGASVQEWLDGALTAGAGTATDNYIFCLIRAGEAADYSGYVEAAAAKLEAGISNASTRQRTALALIACGAAERVPTNVVDESAGKLGIMSWIWALHLLNNGAPSELWTREAIVEQLLSMQLEDGGWRVTGDYGDVDVTSMCLQALACCGIEEESLDAAIARALDFLSSRQRESGGFASMGNENAESAAQVLIAFAALGIPEDDPRFVKDGNTPLTALMAYQLPSGGFAHFPEGEESATATTQALQALIALECSGDAFYDFSNAGETAVSAVPAASPYPTTRLPAWKRWAFAAICILGAVGSVFALVRGHNAHRRVKRLFGVWLIAAIAAAGVCFIQLESAEDYYGSDALAGRPADGHVTLAIRCDRVAGRADDGSTPNDGVILPVTELPFAEGDTVFDALTAAARQFSIQMEHQGAGELAYINGINYLYEFSYGDLSGWIYSVNGEIHSTGCGSYKLSDGDDILWQYTTELGEDLK